MIDWPRFQHRGHMIDVARNFHSNVSDIKKVIDAMAMYKMNRLHFHLGDDEGWRLEIPQLPELTEVNHDTNVIKLLLLHARVRWLCDYMGRMKAQSK